MSVIKDLLRIKIFREEKAEIELLKSSQFLKECEIRFSELKTELAEFRKKCLLREKNLYADLCSRLVVQKDINNVSIEIELMKEESMRKQQDVESAREKKDKAKELRDLSKIAHREAVRMSEKFSELWNIEQHDKEFEKSRIEDIEMEEVAETRHARGEVES